MSIDLLIDLRNNARIKNNNDFYMGNCPET